MSRLRYILEASLEHEFFMKRNYVEAHKALVNLLKTIQNTTNGHNLIDIEDRECSPVLDAVSQVLNQEQIEYLKHDLINIGKAAEDVPLSNQRIWFKTVKAKYIKQIETAIELVQAAEHWNQK